MPTRYLITGAGGFIGRPLAERLRAAGHEVIPLTRHEGDICGVDILGWKPDVVLHLAAQAYVPLSWENPKEVYRVNALGTLNVLEACRKARIPFLYMSSYAYGNPQRLPIDESHPLSPRNPYALSKIAGEDAARFYADVHRLPVTIARPFNPYGPGQPPNFVIPHILRQVLDPACEAVEVLDLLPRRDFVYIQDMVDAVARLAEGGIQGTFNIGSGRSFSVEELARCAMATLGIEKPLYSEHEPRPHEISDVVADIRALREATGWIPLTSLPEGLARMAAFLQAEAV
jgi:nucleoside-diphosphate-sugar epimerase